MPSATNRNIKVLGAAWLVLGGLTFAFVLISLFPLVQGDTPSPFEAGDEWWIVLLVIAAVGAILTANGLTLLRRNPVARPFIAISSVILLIPSATMVVPLLVVVPSLWLTLSRGGRGEWMRK